VLLAAGFYNLAWGSWVMLRPADIFTWSGADPNPYPQLWQAIGMFVFVWGIGYLIAASDPWRHWPIVLVGLLGRTLGPIGFLIAVSSGALPPAWGWTILTNDLIWWPAFALILLGAMRAHVGPDAGARLARAQGRAPSEALPATTVASNIECALPAAPVTVRESDMSARAALLARTRPSSHSVPTPDVLVVFLRHSGCIFCKEAMAAIARQRSVIEADGTRIVLVHLDEDAHRFQALAARHGLAGVELISDPDRRLYRAFELRSAPIAEHFTWRQWLSGARAWLSTGQFVGAPRGDALQLPGIVRISGGEVVRSELADRSGMRIDLRSFVPVSNRLVG
jgi:peroxiredoxin